VILIYTFFENYRSVFQEGRVGKAKEDAIGGGRYFGDFTYKYLV